MAVVNLIQIDSDEDGKKKTRAPISAERKLKKKVAFCSFLLPAVFGARP